MAYGLCLSMAWLAAGARAQEAPPGRPPPTVVPGWTHLEERDFLRTLGTSQRPLLVLLSSRFCAACPAVDAALGERSAELAAYGDLYEMELADVTPGFADRYAVQGVPTLLVFLDRELADVVVVYEVTEAFLDHVLTRNGLAEGGAPYLADERERVGTMAVPEGSAFLAMDLTGASLAGRSLRGVLFSGCGLRGVDLSGVDLTGAVFSRTDLTGANLSGAALDGARWINSVCPDGSSSRAHGDSCPAGL